MRSASTATFIDGATRAYILADNKLAERAGWDRTILAGELRCFMEIGHEIELTGFEMPEIDLVLKLDNDLGQRSTITRPETRSSEAKCPEHGHYPRRRKRSSCPKRGGGGRSLSELVSACRRQI